MLKIRISIRRFFCIAMVALFIGFSGCSGSSEKGACIRGTGVTSSCGDSFDAGECDALGGIFYEGKTCSDLAYNSN